MWKPRISLPPAPLPGTTCRGVYFPMSRFVIVHSIMSTSEHHYSAVPFTPKNVSWQVMLQVSGTVQFWHFWDTGAEACSCGRCSSARHLSCRKALHPPSPTYAPARNADGHVEQHASCAPVKNWVKRQRNHDRGQYLCWPGNSGDHIMRIGHTHLHWPSHQPPFRNSVELPELRP